MKTKHSPSILVHALHIVKFEQNIEITAEKQISCFWGYLPNQFSGIPVSNVPARLCVFQIVFNFMFDYVQEVHF